MKNLKNNFATVSDAQMSTSCIVCQKPIVDNQWFCRLPQQGDSPAKILLCSPSCAYRHFANFDDQISNHH